MVRSDRKELWLFPVIEKAVARTLRMSATLLRDPVRDDPFDEGAVSDFGCAGTSIR